MSTRAHARVARTLVMVLLFAHSVPALLGSQRRAPVGEPLSCRQRPSVSHSVKALTHGRPPSTYTRTHTHLFHFARLRTQQAFYCAECVHNICMKKTGKKKQIRSAGSSASPACLIFCLGQVRRVRSQGRRLQHSHCLSCSRIRVKLHGAF